MVGGNIFNVMIIVKRINKCGYFFIVYYWVLIINFYNVNIYIYLLLNIEIFLVFLILFIIYE